VAVAPLAPQTGTVTSAPGSPASPRPLALVAGASRGLGLLIARELADRGHRVVICARDRGALDQAGEMLRRRGAEVQVEVCDVSDNTAVTSMVERVERTIGPIETLVTVAGVIQVGPMESLERRDWETAIGVMLWGPVNCSLAVVERMRERGHGQVGTITSIGGVISVPHLLPYSTAKFGAVGFTQGLRAELAGTGVTVTTVVPGLMRTGSHVRASFVGNQKAEYAWFAAGASAPLVAMDAERAVARIVDGILAGKPRVVLTPLARAGMLVAGLAPATTVRLMGVMGRLLPSAPGRGSTGAVEGRDAERQLSPRARRWLRRITVLGERAAERFNED
jgi:short-subunit dehydrogenase